MLTNEKKNAKMIEMLEGLTVGIALGYSLYRCLFCERGSIPDEEDIKEAVVETEEAVQELEKKAQEAQISYDIRYIPPKEQLIMEIYNRTCNKDWVTCAIIKQAIEDPHSTVCVWESNDPFEEGEAEIRSRGHRYKFADGRLFEVI